MKTKTAQNIYYNDTDKQNTDAAIQAIANLGLLSLGGGIAYGGIRNLLKRLRENRTAYETLPSKYVRNAYDSQRIGVDNELLSMSEKKATIADWLFGNTYTKDDISTYLTGAYKIKDMTPDEKRHIKHVNSDTSSFGDTISATLASQPMLRPLWSIPSAMLATYGGAHIGAKAVNALNNIVLGQDEQSMPYYDEAKKIYEESAKYLRDVESGKIQAKKTKSSSAKPNTFNKSAGDEDYSGDGKSTPFSPTNPWLYAGIGLAGLTINQIKNLLSGYNNFEPEESSKANLIRAWQATKNNRPYNYTDDLEIALEDEPSQKNKNVKSIINRERALLNTSMT